MSQSDVGDSMRRPSQISIVLSACVGGISSTALAQEASPAEAVDVPCELHIWPTEHFASLPFRMGVLFPGFNAEGVDSQFKELVGPELQFAALDRADPIKSLGLPANTVIYRHAELETDKVTKKRKERRATSDSQCYYELHVRFSDLIEDVFWGDRFSTYFDLRKYTVQEDWDLRFRSDGGNKLTVFPVEEGDDPAKVSQEIGVAIEANFSEFAKKAKRRLARASR